MFISSSSKQFLLLLNSKELSQFNLLGDPDTKGYTVRERSTPINLNFTKFSLILILKFWSQSDRFEVQEVPL